MKKVFMLHLKVDRFWAQSQVPKSITLIFSRLRNRWHFRAFSSIMYARTRFFRLLIPAVFVDSGSQCATFSRPNPCCFRQISDTATPLLNVAKYESFNSKTPNLRKRRNFIAILIHPIVSSGWWVRFFIADHVAAINYFRFYPLSIA